MGSVGKSLIVIGIALVILGLIFMVGQRIGLGKLPGDIFIRKGNFVFIFPIASTIIISLILTLILNFLRR